MNLLSKIIPALALCVFAVIPAFGGWQKMQSRTLAWLHDVYFLNDKNGWIAGSDGVLLRTSDGGATWNTSEKFTSDTLKQIYFRNETSGWALCERNTYTRLGAPASYLMRTEDAGKTWEKVEFAGQLNERVTRVYSFYDGRSFAVGESGLLLSTDPSSGEWKRKAAVTRFLLRDIEFLSDRDGVAVGGGGSLFVTSDKGESWFNATIFGAKAKRINAVYFLDKTRGYAVGADGIALQTVNGGKTWRALNANTNIDLNDVAFADSKIGFAVGAEGVIVSTENGGNTWTVENLKSKHVLESIAVAGSNAIAVGFGGTLLRYTRSVKNEPVRPTFNTSRTGQKP